MRISHLKKYLALGLVSLCASTVAWSQVGMREVVTQDMHITLVYPTQTAVSRTTRGPFEIEVALNAPLASQARHVVVMSHGTGGSALSDFTLAATLARAGFVVAQPEHRGDNYRDFSKAGPPSWLTRPQEITETIDWLAQDKAWNMQLDLQHVGVHGMSAGGVSALVMAGAQWHMMQLIRHCAQHLDEDIGFCMNGLAQQPDKQALRRRQFQTASQTDDTWLPEDLKTPHGGRTSSAQNPDPRPDHRVVAVSALVPLAAIFTPESLARIQIPVGLTTADKDEVLLPQFHAQHVLKNCTTCTVLSANAPAGHFDWLSPWPAPLAQQIAAQQIRGGLPHDNFTEAQRQWAFDRIADFFKSSLAP